MYHTQNDKRKIILILSKDCVVCSENGFCCYTSMSSKLFRIGCNYFGCSKAKTVMFRLGLLLLILYKAWQLYIYSIPSCSMSWNETASGVV